MPLDAKDYKPGDAIYAFVDNEGNNTHVDSEKLNQWCREKHDWLERGGQVLPTPVDPKIAESFIRDNVIDWAHALEVLAMPALDPIIYGKWGTETNGHPDVILIDGHHRYYCAHLAKYPYIPAYILEPEQWREFEIIGLPKTTEELLRQAPTKAQARRLREAGLEPVLTPEGIAVIKRADDER